jgi:hypothetical protein
MALCAWISRLDPLGAGRPFSVPRAIALMQSAGAGSSNCYAASSAGAMGVSSLTSAQITALDADAAVWARELPAGWRNLTVSQLPAAVVNKLQTILTNQGIVSGVVGTDTLPQAFQKIVTALAGENNIDISVWPARFDSALSAEPF